MIAGQPIEVGQSGLAAGLNPPPLEPEQDQRLIAGRYRTEKRIGRGRLGDVFLATDEEYKALGIEQQVAIQVVSSVVLRNNTLFNKLNAGYDTLITVSHPNVVGYRRFGRDDGFVYLVMEYLHGGSLRFLLNKVGTLPIDEVVPVIRGVAEALQLVHAMDWVHGNLTPDNVFITDELEVRLLDVVPLVPSESIFRGKGNRIPPGRGSVADDIYALGCLAYEMLAGKPPYQQEEIGDARPADLEPDRIQSLPDRDWAAIRRALSLDPERRTASVKEFLREFGVEGTERLRPTDDRNRDEEPTVNTATESLPPRTSIDAPRPAIAGNTMTTEEYRALQKAEETARNRVSPFRAVFLLLLLTGVASWSYFGQPQRDIAAFMAPIEARMTTASPAPVVVPNETTVSESEPVVVPEPEPIAQAVVDNPPAIDRVPVAVAVAVPDQETTGANASNQSAPSPQSATEAQSAIDTSAFVSVSERDGSARVTARRLDNAEGPLIWWTSNHTAMSDSDFVPTQQRELEFESETVLHIPLINDNQPERDESFFVNFGFRDSIQGRIDRVATVRVDIVDDDAR